MPIIEYQGERIVQRSAKGLAFEKYLHGLSERLRNPDSDIAEELRTLNAHLHTKSVVPSRVTLLENMSVQYANDEYIGTRIMPEVMVDVSKGLSVEYWEYTKANKFSYPSATLGTRNSVNEVSEGVSRTSMSLSKKALKEFADLWDASMQDNVVADLLDPAMNVLDGLAFNEELDIATVACTSSNYGTNTAAIDAADRWDAGGDPGPAVDAAKRNLWSGTGAGRWVGFCSRAVYDALKRNPFVLDRFKTTGGTPYMANREMLAQYFEIDELLIGDARKNTANEGQTASYSRIWSDVFGIVRAAVQPSRRNASFGVTIKQNLLTQTWFQDGVGGRGGNWVQSSTAWGTPVVCADCGYLLTTPIG